MFCFLDIVFFLYLYALLILSFEKKMQAYGRYDFSATANDELSFQKGAMLKVYIP